jgi:hypothetical protein
MTQSTTQYMNWKQWAGILKNTKKDFLPDSWKKQTIEIYEDCAKVTKNLTYETFMQEINK